MRYKCFIRGCQSNYASDPKLSVHQLPVKEDIRAKWTAFIGIGENESCSDSIRVCSMHFTEDQFKRNCYQRRLVAGAIPTIKSGLLDRCQSLKTTPISTTEPKATCYSSDSTPALPNLQPPTVMCTSSFLKRFQESLPNYTLTRDAHQNVQIKILSNPLESSDPTITKLLNVMQAIASFHVNLTKFQTLFTTKSQQFYANIQELSSVKPVLVILLNEVHNEFQSMSIPFSCITTISQSLIVEAIEVHEKYLSKSDQLQQDVLSMNYNTSQALISLKNIATISNRLRELRLSQLLKTNEEDEKNNVLLEISTIDFDFLLDEISKYTHTSTEHLYFLRNPINFLSDRVKFLKKNFGDRLEHTLVPYRISRDYKTQLLTVKIPTQPKQPSVKNEEYVIKIMQLAASLYVHLSKSEKEIVTKCLEVTACIESLRTLCLDSIQTLQNIQTRIRATSKQISKLVYFTIRLMNTSIDIETYFNPVNIGPLITALRSVAGYTSMALESIYLVENLVKELKERREDVKKINDEHSFLKDTFIINLDLLLEMVEKYTLLAGHHLNLKRYKLYFLREYVKQFPAPPKRKAENHSEYQEKLKKKKQLQIDIPVATEKCQSPTNHESLPLLFDLESLHAAMKNVFEIDLPLPENSEFLEKYKPAFKEEPADESETSNLRTLIKAETTTDTEEQTLMEAYIKPEPADYFDEDSEGDSMPPLTMPETNFSVYTEQTVDGFIIREIKEEASIDYC